MTVYSVEKAAQIAAAARRLDVVQPLLLRTNGPEDIMMPTAVGGFEEKDTVEAARQIMAMPGVSVEGITTYPAIRYDVRTHEWGFTPNFDTLLRVRDALRERLGVEIRQVNAAGNTCVSTMRMLVEAGASHGEPGHAFVGSNPGHAFRDLEEIPAQVYVTEVSHFWGGSAYAYGTGLIANPTIGIWNSPLYESLYGAIGPRADALMDNQVLVEPPHYVNSDPANYMYCRIKPARKVSIGVGDTLVLGMRTQLYKMTSARAAVVDGIQSGSPRLLGLFDRTGNLLDPDTWLPMVPST
jgi:predicted amino acid racemase